MGEEELRWGECSFPRGSAIPGHQSRQADMLPCAQTPLCAHGSTSLDREDADRLAGLQRKLVFALLGGPSPMCGSPPGLPHPAPGQGVAEADAHACARSIRRLPARSTAHPRSGAGTVTATSDPCGRNRMEAPTFGRPDVNRSPAAPRTIPLRVIAAESPPLTPTSLSAPQSKPPIVLVIKGGVDYL